MIGKHDPARAYPNGRCATGHVADQNRGGGAGDSRHIMMLGEPVTRVSPAFRVLRQIECVAQGIGHAAAFRYRSEIE